MKNLLFILFISTFCFSVNAKEKSILEVPIPLVCDDGVRIILKSGSTKILEKTEVILVGNQAKVTLIKVYEPHVSLNITYLVDNERYCIFSAELVKKAKNAK